MKLLRPFLLLGVTALFAFRALGQIVTVIDPTRPQNQAKLSQADEHIFKNDALPRVKKKISSDACDTQETDVAGVVKGSFTKPGAKQTLIFYQYCQTGNGLGWAGLVLIEDGKVIGNFVADSGWTRNIEVLADINRNHLNEFTLSWGGGTHQGEGGVGVDIMEFADGRPKGLGWFQAEQYDDTQATRVWRVTVKASPVPVFYRQKYFSGEGEKWRRQGANSVFKLTKSFIGKFEAVK